MIDIVFIMLIFFIVTATFIKESGLDVSKPDKIDNPPDSEKKSILVLIDESNQVWVDQRPCDIRAVRANIERVRAENPQGGVRGPGRRQVEERDSRSGHGRRAARGRTVGFARPLTGPSGHMVVEPKWLEVHK